MSCEECEEIQNLVFDKNVSGTTPIAYIRVDKSNLAIVGCKIHVMMAIDKLNSETSHNSRTIQSAKPFFYQCPDCDFSTNDEKKTEHICES